MGKVVSMTGFGRGEASGKGGSWIIELRAVNHRYLDIGIKLPRRFMGWEDRIKKEISSYRVIKKSIDARSTGFSLGQ